VQRLVEGIAEVCNEKIEEISFVIGDFGVEVENSLLKIAEDLGARGKIFYQEEALGTAHAVICAEESLEDKVIVAFADTLFYSDFHLDEDKDGIIWVDKVDDPTAFGVVQVDENGIIAEFVEKPEEFVSDLAIIGIYYFKDGNNLKEEIKYLIDNKITDKGEYQLTNALENMKSKGKKFYPGKVEEWLDCGNKNATIYTNNRVLERTGHRQASNVSINNSVIIEPCFIGENVVLNDCVVGPHVSIGIGSKLNDVVMKNSIVQNETEIGHEIIENSMIGSHVQYKGKSKELNLGDYNQVN